ncbi:MAG: chemotaxis protein CheA, partial [Firmicutes bacterium]|nr:chemotaxis protein CheA [Bacillota bacterium]
MADFSRESMLDMFIFEMNQLLEQLEQLIIQGEQGYSMDDINEIFRIMHTIKGSAAMMLYDNVSKTAHAIEDLFYYLREENPTDVDYSSLTDLVLLGMDFIKVELDKIESGNSPDADPTETIGKIKSYLAVLKGETPAPAAAAPAPAASEKKEEKKEESTPAAKQTEDAAQSEIIDNRYTAKVMFEKGCEMENVRAFTLLHNLEDVITDVVTIPENVVAEESEEIIRENGFTFTFTSEKSLDELKKLIGETVYLDSFEVKACALTHYKAFLKFEDGCEMENVRAFTIIHNLESIAVNIKHTPEDLIDEAATDVIREKGFEFEFSIGKSYDDVYDMLMQTVFLKDLKLTEVEQDQASAAEPKKAAEPVKAAEPAKEAPKTEAKEEAKPAAKAEEAKTEPEKKEAAPAPKKAPTPAANNNANKKQAPTQQMISVNIGKLDQLMNLMGELVISEAMTTQNPDLDGLELENFNRSARQLRKIINDVQDTVMSMRMVSLSTTFFKMHRIVRDMCKQLGKNVELVVVGEETEVDKNIIEHISDPLMHIIRNSVDHGIEMPEKRKMIGKDEKGTVLLEAKNSGGEVLIIVKDDGAGINKEKVMAKAKANGLLKKPEEEYTDREIYQFIFHAGLSTNDTVTNYSGRGVGMDVVVSNVEAVGGTIIVESGQGEGTTTILKIPLTLAIIEGMLIKMGGAKYTIPIASIHETFKPKKENIFTDPDGNEMITIRDDVYNIVRLDEFFGTKSSVDDIEDGVLIMLENEGQQVCLFVDELVGEQQVVVKTMPKFIKRIKGISGCTLLGNGDISLIIDVAGF